MVVEIVEVYSSAASKLIKFDWAGDKCPAPSPTEFHLFHQVLLEDADSWCVHISETFGKLGLTDTSMSIFKV